MAPVAILNDLVARYPTLAECRDEILAAFEVICKSFSQGGKLLVAGNGGSAADAEHIVGELMKSFILRDRQVDSGVLFHLREKYGERGSKLASVLEGALPAIPLTGFIGLSTAFGNDVDPQASFAQQVYGLGRKGDVFCAISTSGNSNNLISALMVAEARGVETIGLTGRSGGLFNDFCKTIIHAPADETYKIQELHLPIYHTLCMMLEAEFFGKGCAR